ncbi:MAG: hypothetical protein KIT14_20780 [bacterium]|nr:hypothetical protein [bacterium]
MRMQRMCTGCGGESGVSLVETLAATTLFAIVAAGVATMAGTSMRHTTNNRQSSAAQLLAQEELENLRGLPFAQVTSRQAVRTVNGVPYQVASQVTAGDPAPGMSRIVTTVTWDGPLGERSYGVETIFTSLVGGSQL